MFVFFFLFVCYFEYGFYGIYVFWYDVVFLVNGLDVEEFVVFYVYVFFLDCYFVEVVLFLVEIFCEFYELGCVFKVFFFFKEENFGGVFKDIYYIFFCYWFFEFNYDVVDVYEGSGYDEGYCFDVYWNNCLDVRFVVRWDGYIWSYCVDWVFF